MIPKQNQIYKHFKGNLYKIITLAIHTETEETLVIYQALYGDFKIYARPLSMFMEEVDRKKYPDAVQTYRFELVEQIVDVEGKTEPLSRNQRKKEAEEPILIPKAGAVTEDVKEQESEKIDPLLEAYLDTDSCRERLNILHGMHHRITEHMLITMAVVIDFELPEGDLEEKYTALKECLMTKEKYECGRNVQR